MLHRPISAVGLTSIAENYYGADYPEDEVASDDEYGQGAYNYRKGRGSDDEEYGSESDVWSDAGEANRFPWKHMLREQMAEEKQSQRDGDGDDSDVDM